MQAEPGVARGEIAGQLNSLKEQGLFRRRHAVSSPQASRITLDGEQVLNFCSNDYLGLANDPRIIRSLQGAVEKYGVGSGASALVCGRSTAHLELEEEVARLTGRDRAIIFSSGYLANLAVVSALVWGREDVIFQDRLNHASLIDGAILGRAKLIRYPHKDTHSLRTSIQSKGAQRKLVLTDALFSMDGDFAPLTELVAICKQYDACMIVDDAHGFGVFGENGAGTLVQAGIKQTEVPLMVATFGKAVGCGGAFVAGREDFIELLVQKARPYIYSTAMPPALAVAATTSLRLIETEVWRRQHLAQLIERFRNGARQAGLQLLDSNSPIQPLLIGAAKKAVTISDALLKKGILITAMRPPTVPENTSRLRITLSAGHSEEDVDILLDALAGCCPGAG